VASQLRALSVAPLSVRTIDPFRIASGEVHGTRSILVQATLERGGVTASGMGEGACLPPVTREDQRDALTAVERAIPRLQGATIDDLVALASELDQALAATPVARAAVEVAILSALSTLDGQPLWRWLSGAPGAQPSIESDITLPILAPARMAELAARHWSLGFTSFKVKIGRDLVADLDALAAVGRAVPRARFLPDANAGLKVEEALAYVDAARARGLEVACFEQPTATLPELRRVADALDLPVLADESVQTMADFEALVAASAADGINLKIAKTGSLLRSLALGRAAQQRGMPLMVGGMVETRLGMTAAAHLVAALGGVAFPDLDTAWLLAEDPFVGGYRAEHPDDPTRPGPRYRLSEAPGLAITLR
jgi:L-alanine-DL-glutamate epimerase-like enolase superfamily enzyme